MTKTPAIDPWLTQLRSPESIHAKDLDYDAIGAVIRFRADLSGIKIEVTARLLGLTMDQREVDVRVAAVDLSVKDSSGIVRDQVYPLDPYAKLTIWLPGSDADDEGREYDEPECVEVPCPEFGELRLDGQDDEDRCGCIPTKPISITEANALLEDLTR